jgi:hypothetical protein
VEAQHNRTDVKERLELKTNGPFQHPISSPNPSVSNLTYLGELLDEPLGTRVPEQGDVRREDAVALRQPLVVLVVELGVEVLIILFHGHDASCQAFDRSTWLKHSRMRPVLHCARTGEVECQKALRRFSQPVFEWMKQ